VQGQSRERIPSGGLQRRAGGLQHDSSCLLEHRGRDEAGMWKKSFGSSGSSEMT